MPQKYGIITEKILHGRTLTTVAATDRKNTRVYAPLIPGFKHVRLSIEALRQAVDKDLRNNDGACTGESGVHPLDVSYVTLYANYAMKRALLILMKSRQAWAEQVSFCI